MLKLYFQKNLCANMKNIANYLALANKEFFSDFEFELLPFH